MTASPQETPQPDAAPPHKRSVVDAARDARTGLPALPTWRGVYVFVLICFALWVGLLAALTFAFS